MRQSHDRTRRCSFFVLVMLSGWLQGCGLLMDAAELIAPMVPDLPDEVDVICRHRELKVGISVEPYPPFVFPVVQTTQGSQVTGFDLELVQQIAAGLSKHCNGSAIVAVPHVVHFRDLFRLLTDGQLDMFVSSVAYNVPHLKSAGLAYSAPYYNPTGLSGIARGPEVVEQVRSALSQSREGSLKKRRKALDGLIVAVQEGRSAQFYAQANLKGVRMLACDSLAAALQTHDPPVDVILGKQPVLDFILKREPKGKSWRALVLEDGRPFLLNRELFTVVMSERSFHLHWLVNDLLFELEESGRLAAMQHRWFEEEYAFVDRTTSEGLLAVVPPSIDPPSPGGCHWTQPQ